MYLMHDVTTIGDCICIFLSLCFMFDRMAC